MPTLKLQITARRDLTDMITEFDLSPIDEAVLPDFVAGAHVTLQTPSGAMRRYSLVNSPDGSAPQKYTVAIKREMNSRGGSASMHADALVGTEISLEPPQNDFALTQAPDYLLIAGGIGITPILSMARDLERQGKPFRIIYCTRSPQDTAYHAEMVQAYGPNLTLHHDQGDPDQAYDFWDDFADPKPTHVFCCGPQPLMEEIKAVSGHWPEGRVHFEDFKPVEVVRAEDTPITVTLQKSGADITVPADRTILEALRDAGIATVSSCESGTCGTCKCGLLDGEADHRDMVLTDAEKTDHIMICVSRAKSGRLVLDL